MKSPNAQLVADILNLFARHREGFIPFTAEEIEQDGLAYAFTELTEEEAMQVGAKAYIKRRYPSGS